MPVFFILDEFANIGRIPDFDKKISTSRSRGIQFSVILQNLDQLEAVYEKSYETIMGNCDTHVFLGSNSFKTVEYFSKALGEKTISRDSNSVNKDKHFHKQGFSQSEQIMARPLMTPDELRRMDNDLCIIYEKGIKPVKAEKYYYFEQAKVYKDLQQDTLDHNDFDVGARGEWRKYNPYNPYVPDKPSASKESLKVESLDDLFDDEIVEEKKENKEENIDTKPNEMSFDSFDFMEEETEQQPIKQEVKEQKVEEDLFDFSDFTSPEVPQEPINEDAFTEDLQKELEAKFDELFGPME